MNIIKDAVASSYSGLPISDFADWIKVNYSGNPAPDDIQSSLNGAAAYIEKISWTRLATRAISFIANGWGNYAFELELSGNMSDPICTYFDTNNASQSLVITSSWLERIGDYQSIFHVVAASFPALYDRADALTISFTLTPFDTTVPAELKTAIYLLGGYYYDCRVNDKEVLLTVVDKIVLAVRHKEF